MSEIAEEETVVVTLSGAGIDIKREIGIDKLALLMSVLMGAPPPGVDQAAPQPDQPASLTKVSLREFLDSAKASTKPDQIVAIGHYMALHEGQDTFSRDDIKARFQAARERLPSNLPRDFSVAISKAMVAEDHAKAGRYYVTARGAKAVESQFSGQK